MRPIDRVIVEVNNKVYSFLNPLFFDETEYPYHSNHCKVENLAVCVRYNKDFINDITIHSNKTFIMLRSSKLYISLNGKRDGFDTPIYILILRPLLEPPMLPPARFEPIRRIYSPQEFPML